MEPSPREALLPRAETAAESLPRSGVWVLVGFALAVGLLLRFAGLSYPPFDSHSFRQTETLSTIEAYHGHGIDLLHPRTIYMGYPGTFVLELPVFQALAALLYDIFGPHLEIIRILNILFGAATTWLLYRITAFFLDRTTAALAALIYWLAPLNILYQRSMLLDPMAVFFGLVSFYSMALLLAPSESTTQGSAPGGSRTRFAVFAVATWLTAMIKALYLWPAVLLLVQAAVARRFKPDARVVRILTAFAVCGVCFLAWNYYAAQVNDASPFTRGVKPTSHLGIDKLFSTGFYREQIVRRPKWWLGMLGAVLYPIGLLAVWKGRNDRTRAAAWLLLVLVPPTYLALFANINYPHEYYQLIITPFLAVVAGYGLRWLAIRFVTSRSWPMPMRHSVVAAAGGMFILVSGFTYLVWFRAPRLDEGLLKFQAICAGKFNPGARAMVFVAHDASSPPPDSYIPEYLYAAKLWGYGKVVEDAAGARAEFEEFAPAIPGLEYIVFYGTDRPDWLPHEKFRAMIEDDSRRLYVFHRTPAS